MVSILSFRKEIEKNADNIASKVLSFIKKHPVMTAGIIATPIAIVGAANMAGKVAGPIYTITNENKKRSIMKNQTATLQQIYESMNKKEEQGQQLRVEPLY